MAVTFIIFTVQGYIPIWVAAIVLGLINAVMRPILTILTLPITIITLGLFYLLVNGFTFFLASKVVPGFGVSGFWWAVLGAAEKDLNRQKLFSAAQLTHTVQAKTVECAYNYYGVEPERISDKIGIVILSLLFYVVYTCWYGYAIMYMFEGLGFELAAH